MKRWEFLAAIPAALHAFACGQEPPPARPDVAAGGNNAPSGGAEAAPSDGGNAKPSGSTQATGGASGGAGGSAGSGASTGSSGGSPSGGASAKGGSGSVGSWSFDCGDSSLPDGTGARAESADFSANSETGAAEPHVLYLNGYFLIRRARQYVTEGDADHQHEILLTDEQIDALILGKTIVVQTDGPPLNASSGHGHTITIRSCFSS